MTEYAPIDAALATRLRMLEALTGAKALVFGASHIDIDLLPPLYEALQKIGPVPALNAVVYLRGGEVNATRRIALLLHRFAKHLRIVVPHHCESSGTLLCLAAHEIVAGPLAMFSPIDPHMNGAEGGKGPSALAAEDIRQFAKMSQEWFGMNPEQAQTHALSILCNSIFPTTLTSFYRATREMEAIGAELLALPAHTADPAVREAIVQSLLYGFHAHDFSLTSEDLSALGLPVKHDARIEDLAWDIACDVRRRIGPESRTTPQDDWGDAIVATADTVQVRKRNRDRPMGVWTSTDIA